MRTRLVPAAAILAAAVLALGWTGREDRQPAAPFTLEAPRPPANGRLKVLVLHDMEGLAGQDDWKTFDFDFPDAYRRGQELLVADVNAVIDGLFAGGATQVEVVDGHGSGNPDPDIRRDLLDPRATQVLRDRPFRQYVDLVAPDAYDGVVLVGMHAKTGSGGFASHTFTLGIEFIVNGLRITESELVAFSWARQRVPVILVTGDDRLKADLEPTMPWIEYVTVKTATSASTAVPRPVAEAHAEMRVKAKRAAERLRLPDAGGLRAMRLREPVQAAVRVVPPASLAVLRNVPGVRYADEQVSFEAADYQAAYDGMVALTNVASRAYPSILAEVVRGRPGGEDALTGYAEALTMRWLDVESGRWSPPPAVPTAPRKYHGAR
jgi:D-amino peptidase